MKKRFVGADGEKDPYAFYHPDGITKRIPKGVAPILYNLPALEYAKGQVLFVPEGEKDVDTLMKLGDLVAVTSSGTGSWDESHADAIAKAQPNLVVILGDNDDPGRKHAHTKATSISKRGIAVKVLSFDGPKGYDVSDWLEDGGEVDALNDLVDQQELWRAAKAAAGEDAGENTGGASFEDFYAYLPMHNYIFTPSREHWPASSVNSQIPPTIIGKDKNGKDIVIKATNTLDKDRHVSNGGWIARQGCKTFN